MIKNTGTLKPYNAVTSSVVEKQLLAPNGNPSNLTPEQYKLVRTPAFITWFGDWENAPETASKVVDVNGEPLIVYHGAPVNSITEFKKDKGIRSGMLGNREASVHAVFFTPDKGLAKFFARNKAEALESKGKPATPMVYETFIKIKKIADFSDVAIATKILQQIKIDAYSEVFSVDYGYIEDLDYYIGNGDLKLSDLWVLVDNKEIVQKLKSEGYDGAKFIEPADRGDSYAVFDSNQIKLADGSNTTFDATTPDIRYQFGGDLSETKGFKPFTPENIQEALKSMDLINLAEQHHTGLNVITAQFTKGLEVEKEHTDNLLLAAEIVKDHLAESKDYYTLLEEMENNFDDGGRIRKKMFEAKERYAENKMAENAKIETLTEEQHEALAEICQKRHELHTNQKALFFTNSPDYKRISEFVTNYTGTERNFPTIAEEAKLPELKIEWFDDYDNDMAGEYDEDFNLESSLEIALQYAARVNNEIEAWLRMIDKTHGTHYCPIGSSRLFEQGGTLTASATLLDIAHLHKVPVEQIKQAFIAAHKKETEPNTLKRAYIIKQNLIANPGFYNEQAAIKTKLTAEETRAMQQKIKNFIALLQDKQLLHPNEQRYYNGVYNIFKSEAYQLDNRKLDAFAKQFNLTDKAGNINKGLIKELTELAICNYAREMAHEPGTTAERYENIVKFYEQQPNISHRTSQSVLFQQYSTPVPVCYLAGVFCGIDVEQPKEIIYPAIKSAKQVSVGQGYKMFRGMGAGKEYRVEFTDGYTYSTSRASDRNDAIEEAKRHYYPQLDKDKVKTISEQEYKIFEYLNGWIDLSDKATLQWIDIRDTNMYPTKHFIDYARDKNFHYGSKVKDLHDRIKRGEIVYPIVVEKTKLKTLDENFKLSATANKAGYSIRDGIHRVAILEDLGIFKVPALVYEKSNERLTRDFDDGFNDKLEFEKWAGKITDLYSKIFFEPSAGNGNMTIAGNPDNFIVNEIDKIRNRNLKTVGYKEVLSLDASEPFKEFAKKFDAMLTNPPFGTMETNISFSGMPIKKLEHAMAIYGLQTIKDTGKAAIIIGGHTTYDEQGRIQKGQNRDFFAYLYRNYYVQDVINIAGNIYSRQGTTFGIRLILISGRKQKPEGFPPLIDKNLENTETGSMKVVTNFQELYERVKASL